MFSKAFLIDAGERIVWTAIQGFAAAYIFAALSDVPMSFADKLGVAGLAALLSACKAIVAMKIGDSSTAQALPGVESTYTNEPATQP